MMSSVYYSQKKDMDRVEGPWSPEEDEMLLNIVEKCGLIEWSLITNSLPGKSAETCWSRWLSLVKEEMDQIKKIWIPKEDKMLEYLVKKYGHDWSLISRSIPGRSAKTCESRWLSLQRSFTPEEDEMLQNLFEKHGPNWSIIGKSITCRSARSCSSRWLSLQMSFTPEEDKMLQNFVKKHGHDWSLISKSIPGKSSTSCRVRWLSSPQVMPFTPEEDHAIVLARSRHGDRWVGIAELFGRPYDVIENHWNSDLMRKSISMTNDQDTAIGDLNIYVPPPSFSDIGREQGSSYIHDWNLSQEVGSVSESAPSISYMARVNMSLKGTHSYSCNEPAPSWNALNKQESTPMMTDSDNMKKFVGGKFGQNDFSKVSSKSIVQGKGW